MYNKNNNKEKIMEIYETKTYSDENGSEVIEKTRKKLDENGICSSMDVESEYLGALVMRAPMGPMTINFAFPEEYNMFECFENYEEVAKQKAEDIQREIEEHNAAQKIITPNAGEPLIIT